MNSHISVAETHTHTRTHMCAHAHTQWPPPRIIHVSNCCVSPVLSFFKVIVAGMILPIITWLLEPRPRRLCAMWNQLCGKKEKKKKITSVYVFGEALGGWGGGWAL